MNGQMKHLRVLVLIILTCLMSTALGLCWDNSPGLTQSPEELRERMVKYQLELRGIRDKRVLEAMRKVKRHQFLPKELQYLAYEDMPVEIGEGQTISQPYIVALMTELLALKGDERVLEIGTGSGYQAAILAELSKEVYTIEILEPLAESARSILRELAYPNIYVKCADGFLGWPDKAPFDAIVVTCAPEDIPPALIAQLAEDGRLVIPVGRHLQELKLVRKIEGRIITQNIIPVRFVPMTRDKKSKSEDNLQSHQEISNNLRNHTFTLSQDIGERNFLQYQNLERAADYIKQRFKNYGYEPTEEIYDLEGRSFKNIVATKKGKVYPEKIIIVCAHYDSVMGSIGADDNASGVAGLLELSRLTFNEALNKTIKFIAFTNEEPPFFMTENMGSLRYASQAKKNRENIEAVLCLESIGFYSDEKKSQTYPLGLSPFYSDKGNFIGLASNLSSAKLLKKIVREFRKVSDFPLQYLIAPIFFAQAISFSDNWSFWRFGYKAVMITDTAFYRNPYYHTQEDAPQRLNYEYMAQVIGGLYKVIRKF